MKARWVPAIILVLGAILTLGAAKQRVLPLRQPLAEVMPADLGSYQGRSLTIDDAEAEVAGFSNYFLRAYEDLEAAPPWLSVYVGYYESQAQGNTIHSPRNCLPGAGWEPLSSEPVAIELGERTVRVNRYILQNDTERALVLYWYQGRGRVAYDEYRVKLDLLRDAALRRRSDEALVRIVVPLEGEDGAALELAKETARELIPRIDQALPEG